MGLKGTITGLAKVARTSDWRCIVRGWRAARRSGISAVVITGAFGLIPALAGPGVSPAPTPSATPDLAPKPLDVIRRLGDKAWTEGREGKLLSRQGPNQQPGAYDQFRVEIRGSFRGLPPVKITLAPPQAKATPSGVAVKPSSGVAAASPTPDPNAPTWDKAVEGLSIGAVNGWAREFLIGSQLVREGDLMIVELGGKFFPVWVRRVGDGEVDFCDAELHPPKVKKIHMVPKELPDSKEDELTAWTLFLRPR
jgi:hypothetical protein